MQVAAAYTFTHYCLDAREATDIHKINGWIHGWMWFYLEQIAPATTQSDPSYLTPGDSLECLQSLKQTAAKSRKKSVDPQKVSDQPKQKH